MSFLLQVPCRRASGIVEMTMRGALDCAFPMTSGEEMSPQVHLMPIASNLFSVFLLKSITWMEVSSSGVRAWISAMSMKAILWKPSSTMPRSSPSSSIAAARSASMPRLRSYHPRPFTKILWLFRIKKGEMMAVNTNAINIVSNVSSPMCLWDTPKVQRTNANSPICAKLIDATTPTRTSLLMSQMGKQMPTRRTAIPMRATKTPNKKVRGVGMGNIIPMPAKKRHKKKSRMYLIFALKSVLYGKVPRAVPAISAASSIGKPTKGKMAAVQTKKHQARDKTSINSTLLEAWWSTAGITNFA
mmetsp:Transcript_103782/g.334595  ORF Transcript_103782/g.334595 Transcript_103782/m.334595 type:complete len:301 (+) Transcript_103782:495-1397(+)